ncbi:winged helix-turn-helix domain-containing protein [uncultured Thiodictyon sp.]|jgi:transposase|uniref:helix-turn-helix domain-containing protein n=1 Tax=uncultured Thiodictyon sp. TaxID=1846217 RepID=UPI0025E2988E|nr:winged helix-turn-helix domain-containing protein [uncultured Thiodictyon sp.]
MLDYTISTEQLAELRAAQWRTRDQREADRIKAVLSLAGGWPAEQVAEVPLIDSNTVRDHFRRYQMGGLPGLLHMACQGSDCALTDTDLVALDVHVQAHLYLTAKHVAAWVHEEFGVTHIASGMTALLHHLGFVLSGYGNSLRRKFCITSITNHLMGFAKPARTSSATRASTRAICAHC